MEPELETSDLAIEPEVDESPAPITVEGDWETDDFTDAVESMLGAGAEPVATDEAAASGVVDDATQTTGTSGVSVEGGDTPQQQQASIDAVLIALAGRSLTEQETAYYSQLLVDMGRADEDKQRLIYETLYGPAPTTLAASDQDRPLPDPALVGYDEDVQTYIQAAVAAETAEVRARLERWEQTEQQAEYDRVVAGANQAIDVFRTEHDHLSEADLQELVQMSSASGMFPLAMQANGNDPVAAAKQVLEYQYWGNDKFRQAAVDAMVAAERSNAEQSARRKAAANSVSGAGSVIRPVADSVPDTFVAELETILANGIPGR